MEALDIVSLIWSLKKHVLMADGEAVPGFLAGTTCGLLEAQASPV